MDKSNKEFTPNQELLKNLNWLYENDLNRFNFIKTLIECVANNNKISISMSLNEPTHTVTVIMGEYMYKEEFKTLEKARKLIGMVKSILNA